MPRTCPEITARTAFPRAAASLLTAVLALLLTGCGSNETEEELLRRVAVAEAATARAEARLAQAEKAIANVGAAEFAEEVEFSDEALGPDEEESITLVPDNQGVDNEVAAPPPAVSNPAPQGRMPA